MKTKYDPDVAERIMRAWPHQDIGRGAQIAEGKPINTHDLGMGAGDVLCGVVWDRGHIVLPGRIYTAKEWEQVGEEVSAYVAQGISDLCGDEDSSG